MRFGLPRRMSRTPWPPKNVRVEFPDGRVVHCEMIYHGVRDGVHAWTAAAPVAAPRGEAVRIRCDQLPPQTSIGVLFTEAD